jgi:hypothetical protein
VNTSSCTNEYWRIELHGNRWRSRDAMRFIDLECVASGEIGIDTETALCSASIGVEMDVKDRYLRMK